MDVNGFSLLQVLTDIDLDLIESAAHNEQKAARRAKQCAAPSASL